MTLQILPAGQEKLDGRVKIKSTGQNTGSGEGNEGGEADNQFDDISVRSNFNETAFFYPHLRTTKR